VPVKFVLISAAEKTQVGQGVVRRVVILMVHHLDIARQQMAAQGLLNDQSMLRNVPKPIAVRVFWRFYEDMPAFFDVATAFPSPVFATPAGAARGNWDFPLQAVVARCHKGYTEMLPHLAK